MLGGASEVLFAAAKDLFKGRSVRAARELPSPSTPTRARVPFVLVGSIPAIHRGSAGEDPAGRELPSRLRGRDIHRGAEAFEFEVAAWK